MTNPPPRNGLKLDPAGVAAIPAATSSVPPPPPPPPGRRGGYLLDGVVDVARLPAPAGPAPGGPQPTGDGIAPVVEHAIAMSGGGMQIRNPRKEIERIYPLAQWIEHNQRHGGMVYRRTIVVVADWCEVPRVEGL